MRYMLIALLLVLACDRKPVEPPAEDTEARTTAPITGTVGATTAPPKPVTPRNPDYEDARGVVRGEGGAFTLLVQGAKPICLPFEAPAEARVDGAKVRFTLYLDEEATPTGCRPVKTLISLRVEPE